MKLELQPTELDHSNGLEIVVGGFAGDRGSVTPSQVFH
jgi:hypothetical protein